MPKENKCYDAQPMFTGIIEATAKVLKRTDTGIILERPKNFDDLKIGASICVSGACLSVTSFDNVSMSFDVVPTTFQKTKLGRLNIGDTVNLERALRADGRLEGHIVLGHCEGVGTIESFADGMLTISIPDVLVPYVVLHGSITIDGVALTIASLEKNRVMVALIPHTLEHSTLGTLQKGDSVNLETDILGKYILKAHEHQ